MFICFPFEFQGEGINFSNLKKTPSYPLIYGSSAKSNSSKVDDARYVDVLGTAITSCKFQMQRQWWIKTFRFCRNCKPDSLEENKIKGRIVLCDNDDGEYSPKEKLDELKRLGGVGLVLNDDETRAVASRYGDFPLTVVSSMDASEILSYINSTK